MKVPRVLLVDPDHYASAMYTIGLENAGFEVAVDSTFKALFAGMTTPINAIVMEWEYLRIPAVEVIRRIRSDPTLKTIPILILSNGDGDLERLRALALEAGAQRWHVKANTTPSVLALSITETLADAA